MWLARDGTRAVVGNPLGYVQPRDEGVEEAVGRPNRETQRFADYDTLAMVDKSKAGFTILGTQGPALPADLRSTTTSSFTSAYLSVTLKESQLHCHRDFL